MQHLMLHISLPDNGPVTDHCPGHRKELRDVFSQTPLFVLIDLQGVPAPLLGEIFPNLVHSLLSLNSLICDSHESKSHGFY